MTETAAFLILRLQKAGLEESNWMASNDEEHYPLGPVHTGGDDLPLPVGVSRRQRGTYARLRSKFYSIRPLYRVILVLTCASVPFYVLTTTLRDVADSWHSPWPGPDDEWGWGGHGHHGSPPDDDVSPPDGHPPPPFPPKAPPHPPSTGEVEAERWANRAEEVKDAFAHAYAGYETYAFPHDEILPISKKSIDNFNGWGVSAIDSLDTMIMMGFTAGYNRGVQHLAKIDFKNHNDYVPFFETSIRYFGGLLSAYSYTKDPILLKKADELASALLPALNTQAGYPMWGVRPKDGALRSLWGADRVILAEMGSIQLEYKYLAHLTGRKDYFDKVERIREAMEKHQDPLNSLYSVFFSTRTGEPLGQKFSIGALADSAYEYILKQYLLTGQKEHKLLEMYLSFTKGIIEHLLYISPTRGLLYATDIDGPSPKLRRPSHVYEHLSCFLPGMFALGAHTLPLSQHDKQLHLWVATGLTQTCYLSYADQASGLGPDEISFDSTSQKWYPIFQKWEQKRAVVKGDLPPGVHKKPVPVKDPRKRDYTNKRQDYLLRPETVESIFIMHRVTGDVAWRDMGYEIFTALENYAKVDAGYVTVNQVDTKTPVKQDSMPSYFLAETLKYLFLLFKDGDDRYDLKKVVFNTEAHPLPVFTWSEDEIKHFNISVSH